MTNTLTTDVKRDDRADFRLLLMRALNWCGVRYLDVESSKALKEIVREVTVPIVADIHFH